MSIFTIQTSIMYLKIYELCYLILALLCFYTKDVTPVQTCDQFPVDICFVIDGSGSLTQTGFNEEINFVFAIANLSTSASSRFCYSIFSSAVVGQFLLSTDEAQFRSSLTGEAYPESGTNLMVALSHADSILFTEENRIDNRRRILFFLTDGVDETPVDTLRGLSSSLARKGVETVAIGFGNDIDTSQLMAIGMSQNFLFNNFDEALQRIGNISTLICREQPTCCTGPRGRRGPVGRKGFPGVTGDDGIPGICVTLEECFGYSTTSPKGIPGRTGQKGQRGDDGAKGSPGEDGFIGPRGPKGVDGSKGLKGLKGFKGTPGSVGNRGDDGVKGERGEPGIDGQKGERGVKGRQGQTGSIGVCRSESCVGMKGNQGTTGVGGSDGEQGVKGSSGDTGAQGSEGTKGSSGDSGENGATGAGGNTGEAIEKKEFAEGPCSPSGSLFFDPSTNKLFYCERGRYLCVASNGSCNTPVCLCPTGISCGQFTRSAASEACGKNVAVDFILVVDDTSSMDRQQNWLRLYLPELETALKARCIGNQTGTPNLYQMIAYGALNFPGGTDPTDGRPYVNGRTPHFVIPGPGFPDQFSPPISDPTFTIGDIQDATANLQNIGGVGLTGNDELGYEALEFALNNAVLRQSTGSVTYIPVMILLTNGDADDFSSSRYTALLEQFKSMPNMVLAFALNLGEFTTSNNLRNLFGVANNYEGGNLASWYIPNTDSDATLANVDYGAVTSDVSIRVTPNTEYRNVSRDFINILMCSMRSSASFWDLDFVVNGDEQDVRRFTDAFIQQNADAIINRAQRTSCSFCYCSPSAEEVCANLENEQLCVCLQPSPPNGCECAQSKLQELVQPAIRTFTPSESQVSNIVTTCNLTTTIPPGGDCTTYINYVN